LQSIIGCAEDAEPIRSLYVFYSTVQDECREKRLNHIFVKLSHFAYNS